MNNTETLIFHVNNNGFSGSPLKALDVLITTESQNKQKKKRCNRSNMNWRYERTDSASMQKAIHIVTM